MHGAFVYDATAPARADISEALARSTVSVPPATDICVHFFPYPPPHHRRISPLLTLPSLQPPSYIPSCYLRHPFLHHAYCFQSLNLSSDNSAPNITALALPIRRYAYASWLIPVTSSIRYHQTPPRYPPTSTNCPFSSPPPSSPHR